MKLPLAYIARNLWVRRLTTALTAGGMALVVFVFAAVLMLEAGLRQTLVATGSPNNVLAIRKGASTEIQSGITREQAALIESLPQIARDAAGQPRVSKEVVVLNSLPKRSDDGASSGRRSNVPIRGLPPMGLALRPQVRMIEGRMFRPGASEIESRLKAICDAAFSGRSIGTGDNLFDLGASSLKLLELHEQIDRAYPGQVDLTELFDFPTVSQLAKHLEQKLSGT